MGKSQSTIYCSYDLTVASLLQLRYKMTYMESVNLVLTTTVDPNRPTPKWVGLRNQMGYGCGAFGSYVKRVTGGITHPSFKYLSSNIGLKLSPTLHNPDPSGCSADYRGQCTCREVREDWRQDVIHLLDNLPTFTTYLGRST